MLAMSVAFAASVIVASHGVCPTDTPPRVAGLVIDSDGDQVGDAIEFVPPGREIFASFELLLTGDQFTARRVHFEWAIFQIADPRDVRSARLVLTTTGVPGDIETSFQHVNTVTDGRLRPVDFAAGLDEEPLIVIEPDPGAGVFEVDVTELVRQDILRGNQFFGVQGRVDESPEGALVREGASVYSSSYENPLEKRPTLLIDLVPTCPDLNGDRVVDESDVALLLVLWGGVDNSGDLDCTGRVGPSDLADLLGSWGPCD